MKFINAIFVAGLFSTPFIANAQQKVIEDLKKAVTPSSDNSVPVTNIAVQDAGTPPDNPQDTTKAKSEKVAPNSSRRANMIAVTDEGAPADSTTTRPSGTPASKPSDPPKTGSPK